MATDFFAGCLGGCAGVIVGHPLDTVKCHLQTQDAARPRYTGAMHCLRSLVAKEGVRGLYRGISSPLSGIAAINAIVFGIYGNTQRSCRNPDALSTHFLAGALAGLCQSFLCSPMELAKLRAQVARETITPLQCLKNIYRVDGWRGMFRGLNITILREVPGFGFYFLTYEYCTRTWTPADGTPSTVAMLTAGGLSGVVSWALSYPIDVIKSRVQFDGMQGTPKYRNAVDCLRKSVKAEGYRFMFRGLTPTLVRAFPVNAATFTVVHWTMRMLDGGGGRIPSVHVEVRKKNELGVVA